jgi:uncharacterized protein
MRSRDPVALAALRSTLSAIDNAEAVGGAPVRGLAIERSPVGVGAAEVARRILTPEQVEEIVRVEIAEREAAAGEYERADRSERAGQLRAEAAVLAGFLG